MNVEGLSSQNETEIRRKREESFMEPTLSPDYVNTKVL